MGLGELRENPSKPVANATQGFGYQHNRYGVIKDWRFFIFMQSRFKKKKTLSDLFVPARFVNVLLEES